MKLDTFAMLEALYAWQHSLGAASAADILPHFPDAGTDGNDTSHATAAAAAEAAQLCCVQDLHISKVSHKSTNLKNL